MTLNCSIRKNWNETEWRYASEIFQKEIRKYAKLGKKGRLEFSLYTAAALAACFPLTIFAASDPLGAINNLSTFIFSLIRAIGLILLG